MHSFLITKVVTKFNNNRSTVASLSLQGHGGCSVILLYPAVNKAGREYSRGCKPWPYCGWEKILFRKIHSVY